MKPTPTQLEPLSSHHDYDRGPHKAVQYLVGVTALFLCCYLPG